MTDYRFRILEVVKVIDGDSLRVVVDLGFRVRYEVDVRLFGVNTPEIRGPEREVGKLVRAYVAEWLRMFLDGGLTLHSDKWDVYGRALGRVTCLVNGSEWALNDALLDAGVAKPYDGNGKAPKFSGYELDRIRGIVEGLMRNEDAD